MTRKKRRGEKPRRRPLEFYQTPALFCATARRRILTRCTFRRREIVERERDRMRDREVPVIDGLGEHKDEIYNIYMCIRERDIPRYCTIRRWNLYSCVR